MVKKIVIFWLCIVALKAELNSVNSIFAPVLIDTKQENAHSSFKDDIQISVKSPSKPMHLIKKDVVVKKYGLDFLADLYKFSENLRFYSLFGLLHDEFDEKFAKDFNNTWGSKYEFGLRYTPNDDISIRFGIQNKSQFFVPQKNDDDDIYMFGIDVNLGTKRRKSPHKINDIGEIPITKDMEIK